MTIVYYACLGLIPVVVGAIAWYVVDALRDCEELCCRNYTEIKEAKDILTNIINSLNTKINTLTNELYETSDKLERYIASTVEIPRSTLHAKKAGTKTKKRSKKKRVSW